MSQHCQRQCLYCLDSMLKNLAELEKAHVAKDSQWIKLCLRAIYTDCGNGKMYLRLWHEPEDPDERRSRLLEEEWANREPEIYDPYTHRRVVF